MDLRSIRLALVTRVLGAALALVAGACSTTSSPPPDGTGGGSGTGAGGATATCSNVAPCGGSVVGTWNVTSSCLTISGEQDLTLAGLNCAPAPITGSLHVTGTWTAKADGTYTDGTTTTGTEQFQLAPACLSLSGTTTTCDGIGGPLQGLGFQSVTCTPATNGGCTCTATVNQMGGAGLVSVLASGSGNYSTSGNTLTIDSNSPYSYCVSGSKMTWTPQPTSPTTTGTIVFQGTGATGSGGAVGTGGASATGGASGTGGRGGTTGQGGNAATGGRTGAGGAGGATTGAGGATGTTQGPCDIYAAAGTPCVAAYSTARLLSRAYTGPLYQVRKAGTMTTDGTGANMKTGVRAGGTTMDIGMVAGGFADSAAQDAFCGTDTCTFSVIYDQSGKGNHLRVAPAGCFNDGSANLADYESSAKQKSLTVSGHKVYALFTNAREGYRNNATTGVPMGNMPQGIYELADGTHAGTACCWDFGNVGKDNCNGTTMDTLFFGTGFWGRGAGNGPWFMGDFEGGVWSGGNVGAPTAANDTTATNPSMAGVPFAFGIVKTSSGQYALRMGNGTSGTLTTAYDGASPKNWNSGGGLVLGVGGDNSNHSFGTFFEGALTMGRPSDATDAAVLANVQAAGYGK